MKYFNKLWIKNRFIIVIIKYLYSTDWKQDFDPSNRALWFEAIGLLCNSLHSCISSILCVTLPNEILVYSVLELLAWTQSVDNLFHPWMARILSNIQCNLLFHQCKVVSSSFSCLNFERKYYDQYFHDDSMSNTSWMQHKTYTELLVLCGMTLIHNSPTKINARYV